jgi:RNA polymerase sigma-70 factor (ECF subfamily)
MGTATLPPTRSDVSAPADPDGSNGMSEEMQGLVERAINGDRDAFAALYEARRAAVYRFIYHRVNNSTLADDLTQETFLRALNRIGRFEPRQHIFAWFSTIARNLINDHLKSGWNNRTKLMWTPSDDAVPAAAEHDPAAVAISTDVSVALWALVAKLESVDQRRVIKLRFWGDRSIHEVSQVMNKEEGAIKALQYRAVRTLAQMPEVFALCDRLVPSAPSRSADTVTRILALLHDQPRPWPATEVAERLRIASGMAQGIMTVLVERGQLECSAGGRYELADAGDDVRRRLGAVARSEPAPDTHAGKLLALVRDRPGPWRTGDVATALNIPVNKAAGVLRALVELERLVCLERGMYALSSSDGSRTVPDQRNEQPRER